MSYCAFPGCEEKATQLACSQIPDDDFPLDYSGVIPTYTVPAAYCKAHALQVADGWEIEYVVTCPSCHCAFGL